MLWMNGCWTCGGFGICVSCTPALVDQSERLIGKEFEFDPARGTDNFYAVLPLAADEAPRARAEHAAGMPPGRRYRIFDGVKPGAVERNPVRFFDGSEPGIEDIEHVDTQIEKLASAGDFGLNAPRKRIAENSSTSEADE